MKKLLTLVMALVILAATAFPVAAQRRRYFEDQPRRHRSWFGRKSRTVAIIAGGAALGAVTGGLGTAALLGGGAGLYAFNRRAARRHFKPGTRRVGTIASVTAMGAGIGKIFGGGKATAIGAAAGGAGSYVYARRRDSRRY